MSVSMGEPALVQAVRRDLQELVADLAIWYKSENGGTIPVARDLAASYLIQLLQAEGGEETVTHRLMVGLEEHARKVLT